MTRYVPKSLKVQKVDFGPGNLGPMKSSDSEKNVKTKEIRVTLPRNDSSLSLRSMEVCQIDVTESHFLGFMTRYVPKCQKVQKGDFGPGHIRPM